MDKNSCPLEKTAVTRYGFLLLPDFTMMSFASAVEPLRLANRLTEQNLYEFPLFTLDGEPAIASNGMSISPVKKLSGKEPIDALFICAGVDLHSVNPDVLQDRTKPYVKR